MRYMVFSTLFRRLKPPPHPTAATFRATLSAHTFIHHLSCHPFTQAFGHKAAGVGNGPGPPPRAPMPAKAAYDEAASLKAFVRTGAPGGGGQAQAGRGPRERPREKRQGRGLGFFAWPAMGL